MNSDTKKKRNTPKSVLSSMQNSKGKRDLTWYDRLCKKDQEYVDEIICEWKSGAYPNVTCEALGRVISSEVGVKLTGQTFRRYMTKISSDDK